MSEIADKLREQSLGIETSDGNCVAIPEDIHELMIECVELLSDSIKTADHPVGSVPEDAHVKRLGDQIGYGALMDSARRCWRQKLKLDGIDGGEFTVGHCHATVENVLAALNQALNKGTK